MNKKTILNLNRDIEYINKNKVEMLELKRNISGIKNLLDGLNSRMDVKEESIVKLEYNYQ